MGTFRDKFDNNQGTETSEYDSEELANDLDKCVEQSPSLVFNYKLLREFTLNASFGATQDKSEITLWSDVHSDPTYTNAMSEYGVDCNYIETTFTDRDDWRLLIPPVNLMKSARFRNQQSLQLRIPFISEVSLKIAISVYARYENSSTIVLKNSGLITYNAGENYINLEIPAGYLLENSGSDLRAFEIWFNYAYADVAIVGTWIKYFPIYLGDSMPLSESLLNEAVREIDKFAYDETRRLSEFFPCDTLIFLGDSLTSRGYGQEVGNELDRKQISLGYGGETSGQIYAHFLTYSDYYQYSLVLWVGANDIRSNNVWNETALNNIVKTLELLPHNRFLIILPPIGDYSSRYIGTDIYNEWQTLYSKLKALYGSDRVLNPQDVWIEEYDYGGCYMADTFSFTQPSIGSNVQIEVNDSSVYTATDEIAIGYRKSADEYTVMSIDSATLMTIRLDAVNRIAEGATVENITNDYGTITDYDNLRVMQLEDYNNVQNGVYPASLRDDDIHYTASGVGEQLLVNAVCRRIKQLHL